MRRRPCPAPKPPAPPARRPNPPRAEGVPMKIAALQTVSGVDLESNLASARTLLAEAARAGAELAVLPEYFCLLGQRDSDKLEVRERFGEGPIQSFLQGAARELRMAIVGGTLPLAAGDDAHVRNTSLAFGADGSLLAR